MRGCPGLADIGTLDNNKAMSFSILIVDDEPDIRDLFANAFAEKCVRGATCCFSRPRARTRSDGYTRSAPELFVILSDINMPGMGGLELLAEIRRLRPELPVMIVTAYGDDARKRRAGELGAAAFLAKPIDFDQLRQQLVELMPDASHK
jgi:CheY-like chemotaxis protein